MRGTIITKKGMALIAKLIAGKQQLVFTRAAVGIGKLPSGYDPAMMLDLNEYKMDGEISGYSAEGDQATVIFQVSSVNVEEGFVITEAGLFAQDADEGEILYAYLDMSDDPQYVYAKNSVIQKFAEIEFRTIIGDVENITVFMSPNALVTREEFDKNLEKKIAAIGGDISETVSEIQEPEESDEKYPEFGEKEETQSILGKLYRWAKSLKADKVSADGGDIADTIVSEFAATTDSFPLPVAGDSQKTLWGKIKKFVEDFRNWHTGVCLIGSIVNNCTSTASNLPLSAAQGKVLMDLYTQLYSDLNRIGTAEALGVLKTPRTDQLTGLNLSKYRSVMFYVVTEQIISNNKFFIPLNVPLIDHIVSAPRFISLGENSYPYSAGLLISFNYPAQGMSLEEIRTPDGFVLNAVYVYGII